MNAIFGRLKAWKISKSAYKDLEKHVDLTLVIATERGSFRVIIEITKPETEIFEKLARDLKRVFQGKEITSGKFKPEEKVEGIG